MAIFAVPIGVQLRNSRPPEISKRQFYDSFIGAWQPAGHHWHDEFLPRHFTQAARDMYGHQKRKKKYEDRKRRLGRAPKKTNVKYGGMVDNVFSGASEEALKKSIHIKGSIKGATLRMIGPWYFGKKFAGHPDMVAETTRMIPDEIRQVNEVMAEETMKRFNNSPTNSTMVSV